jgi:uncharacterized protein (TIGR03083 family)
MTDPTGTSTTGAQLAEFYRGARGRVTELVGGLDEGALASPAPACPGWSVADVVSHVVAVAEDVVAGRLTGPPSAEQTAAQVARFQGRSLPSVLDAWAEAAPGLEEAIAAFEVWPAVLDVLAHEQDIRGALGRPGAAGPRWPASSCRPSPGRSSTTW